MLTGSFFPRWGFDCLAKVVRSACPLLIPIEPQQTSNVLAILQPLTETGVAGHFYHNIPVDGSVWRGFGCSTEAMRLAAMIAAPGTRRSFSVSCNGLPATPNADCGRLLLSLSHAPKGSSCRSGGASQTASLGFSQAPVDQVYHAASDAPGAMRRRPRPRCLSPCSQILYSGSGVLPVVFGVCSTFCEVSGVLCAPYS